MATFEEQMIKMRNGRGFLAALDQSGGSTPKALSLYGIGEEAYNSEEEMFDQVHAMRARIITDKAFDGDRILGAILFEGTMNREVEGQPTATYLWKRKQVVPFVKVDKGLDTLNQGVQLMKPMPDLDDLLSRAKAAGIYGTKMRSVIAEAQQSGIEAVVEQQFQLARRIWAAGLVPIVEPEVSIDCPQKADAERLLRASLTDRLARLVGGEQVIFKLTLPEEPNYYRSFVHHEKVIRVVALSGGYTLAEANRRLSENTGVIASFSRALSQELRSSQSDDEFSAALDRAIDSIFQASST